jgi:hypothetical protein
VPTRALAELVRMRPNDGQCGGADANREDKMSLSSLFFRETVYTDEGNRLVGWSAAQLAVSGLTDAGRTLMVEH